MVFRLPQSLADSVRNGTPAIIAIPDRRKTRIHAKVTRVAPTVDSRTGNLRVEIEIPNPANASLRPGMAVNVLLPREQPGKNAPNKKKPPANPAR